MWCVFHIQIFNELFVDPLMILIIYTLFPVLSQPSFPPCPPLLALASENKSVSKELGEHQPCSPVLLDKEIKNSCCSHPRTMQRSLGPEKWSEDWEGWKVDRQLHVFCAGLIQPHCSQVVSPICVFGLKTVSLSVLL